MIVILTAFERWNVDAPFIHLHIAIYKAKWLPLLLYFSLLSPVMQLVYRQQSTSENVLFVPCLCADRTWKLSIMVVGQPNIFRCFQVNGSNCALKVVPGFHNKHEVCRRGSCSVPHMHWLEMNLLEVQKRKMSLLYDRSDWKGLVSWHLSNLKSKPAKNECSLCLRTCYASFFVYFYFCICFLIDYIYFVSLTEYCEFI